MQCLSGFLASKVRKIIHSVCTSGDMTAALTVSSSFRVRANLSFPLWLSKTQLTSFHRWEIGKNRYWEHYEDQIWPVLTQYHELQTDLKYFPGGTIHKTNEIVKNICSCHNFFPLSSVQIIIIPACCLLCVL